MKIRKATKKDFKDFLNLKRQEEKDYSKIIGKRITSPSNNIIKKEFNEALKSRKHIILFVEEKQKIISYIHSTFFKNPYHKLGYIEDIFVLKDFRKKGLAKKMIKEFMKILKKKNYTKIQLSVNPKNKTALKLYKKLGFEIYHYDLVKKIK